MIKKIHIVLGSGHKSGVNKGEAPGYYEGDNNYLWCRAAKEYIERKYSDYAIVTIFGYDQTKVRERGYKAADIGATIYLDIHSDAMPGQPKVGGTTIFESVDLDNEELGEKIGKACANAYGVKFRGCQEKESQKYKGEDYYGSIDSAQDKGVKYVFLLERFFHSNPKECAKGMDTDLTKKSTEAVMDVILEYFGVQTNYYKRELQVDGKLIAYDCLIEDGHIWAGIRSVFEGLGGTVGYDVGNKRVLVDNLKITKED